LWAYLFFPALRATVPCGSDEKQMAPLLTSFFGINTLALLFLGGFVYWKFHKNYADAYQMKTEHRLCMTIVGSTLFLYLILVALGQDASVVALPVTFACNIVFLTGTVWPYYLSRKELALTNKTWGLVEELKSILHDTDGPQGFFQYLQLEFSSENLMFYYSVERFKQLNLNMNITDLRHEAEEIFNKYIRQGACFQVNMSHPISKEIEIAVNKLASIGIENIAPQTLEIFDRGQEEILQLMASDSFKRFQRTEEYLKCKPSKSKINSKHSKTTTGVQNLDLEIDVTGVQRADEKSRSTGNGMEMELQPLTSNSRDLQVPRISHSVPSLATPSKRDSISERPPSTGDPPENEHFFASPTSPRDPSFDQGA